MKSGIAVLTSVIVFALTTVPLDAQQSSTAKQGEVLQHGLDWGIGGMGGVYFLPEPGELIVEVAKRDRNRSRRRTELRAILFSPDRRVLVEKTIPDSEAETPGELGAIQRVKLSVPVGRPGVYGLNITASQDRYGEHVLWGFRTNCARYVIETSRGHRDARHSEPIVLMRPDRACDVAFVPRQDAFEIRISGLPPGLDEIPLYDHEDQQVATLKVSSSGTASYTCPADSNRGDMPWRLHLPKAQATIEIEGTTQWQAGEIARHMACWSVEPSSWFSLLKYRWLLQPYRHLAYAAPGTAQSFEFAVHNNSLQQQQIDLALEFEEQPWAAELSDTKVVLAPRSTATVHVHYTSPPAGEQRVVHLRATPTESSDFTTYSTLTVRGRKPAAERPLDMPVVLKPYEHENAQFGYAPDYPVDNQIYFDLENRPFVRVPAGIATVSQGQWITVPFTQNNVELEPPMQQVPRRIISTKLAFDADNDLYLLAGAGQHIALMHSADGGQTFRAYPVVGREDEPRHFDIEQCSGHNVPAGPPPFVRYTRTDRKTERGLFWRRVNDLDLYVPSKKNGRIVIGEPVRLSDKGLGVSVHSGPPSTIVSSGSKVHVCWGEATDPDKDVPGVPAYVATCDRETHALGTPALIGYGPPANDVHNTPSITIDSAGFLHAIVGTHGSPFLYARSLKPHDAHGGWTDPSPTSEGARQTYVGMVCGHDDTLHLVFRLWHSGEEPFPVTTHARLAYQRKRPGHDWEPPTSLVVPAFSEYGIYYHRLTIDRSGALFLSYDYWSTFWFYRNDQRQRSRSLLRSSDGGNRWSLPNSLPHLSPAGNSTSEREPRSNE